MRQQFANLDTWRGKLTAACVCLAPPAAMVAVFVAGGVTSNTFIVDAHALSQSRQDSVFDELANDLPDQPGVDGSVATERKSQVQVPVTGTVDSTVPPVTGVTGDVSGIPGTVLAAYQKAANDLNVAQPNCGITWPLLAGIGKVESAHASGGRVEASGITRGKILGPVLDGGPGMAAISDTDQGSFDGDTRWDRAVGPMQFIPGTWKGFGADGSGDGLKDPHNIFDAARAAGDYLCSGGANLKDPQGLVRAVLRYNHSMDYVFTVLRWMQSYGKATVTVPDTDGVINPPTDDTGNVEQDDGRTEIPNTPTPTTSTSVQPTATRSPTLTPTPSPTRSTSKPPATTPTSPSKPPKPSRPTVSTTPGSPTPTMTPSETPTTTPTASPTTTPSETPTSTTPTPCTPTETTPPTTGPKPPCTSPPSKSPEATDTPTSGSTPGQAPTTS